MISLLIKTVQLLVFVVIATSSFSSCTAVNQKLESHVIHKRDIQISNMGFDRTGFIVLKHKPLYTIEFKSPGKLDLFTFNSCHRQIAIENARKGLNSKKVKINYKPIIGIETQELCSITVEAWEQKKGRHAWGYIAFEHPNLTLPIYLTMNGREHHHNGVAANQAPMGLIQKVQFDFNVSIVATSLDEDDEYKDCYFGNTGTKFLFEVKKGFCLYTIQETGGKKRRGQLVTFGYERVPLRDD